MPPDAPLDLDVLADALADRLIGRLNGVPGPRYLSVADAASYSGLSTDSVRNLLSGGKLTALRPVRGRVLVDRQELDALIRSSTTRPRRGRGTGTPGDVVPRLAPVSPPLTDIPRNYIAQDGTGNTAGPGVASRAGERSNSSMDWTPEL